MPGLDGTGPSGGGPMTGGGFGRCSSQDNVKPGTGRGLARGRGRGFARFANRSSVEVVGQKSVLDEAEILRQQNRELEAKIETLSTTIDELKTANKPKKKTKNASNENS